MTKLCMATVFGNSYLTFMDSKPMVISAIGISKIIHPNFTILTQKHCNIS